MTLQQRDRLRLVLCIFVIVLVGFVTLVRLRFAPMAEGLA